MWRGLKRPLVAILRGVRPDEVVAIAGALAGQGFEAIEVPLNSPQPFDPIEALVDGFKGRCLVGAGTVLTVGQVDRLAATGAELCISPNTDQAVIQAAVGHGLVSLPGVFTPTEALLAVREGATALKFFPASVLGPDGIKAVQAVLPTDFDVAAVGGVSEADFAAYASAGVRAFGLGSSIYKPGDDAATVTLKAQRTITAWDAVNG